MEQPASAESDVLTGFRAVWEEGNRAWNEGDLRRAYGALPPDFELTPAPSWPNARTLRGPDEIVAFFEDLRKTFPDAHADLRELVQVSEDTVVVGFDVSGTGGLSGARTSMQIWQVWDFPQGIPTRLREFQDRSAAFEAATKVPTPRDEA